jgi:hypothetical protein
MCVGMGAECVRAYALKEYVLSTVCRTIFSKGLSIGFFRNRSFEVHITN